MLTHLAWIPSEWEQAATDTLAGLAERHPSRVILLLPDRRGGRGCDRRAGLASLLRPRRRAAARLLGGARAAPARKSGGRAREHRHAAPARRPAGLPALARATRLRRSGLLGPRRSRRPADRRHDRVAGRAGRVRRARRASSTGPPSRTSPGAVATAGACSWPGCGRRSRRCGPAPRRRAVGGRRAARGLADVAARAPGRARARGCAADRACRGRRPRRSSRRAATARPPATCSPRSSSSSRATGSTRSGRARQADRS